MAQIDVRPGNIVEGSQPGRALRLSQEWAERHREELLDNFTSLQLDRPRFRKIEPLSKLIG